MLLCWLSSATGGPAMAWPAMPDRPIWLKLVAGPASNGAAAAAAFAPLSGEVSATERISGAATVQFDGTDSAPIVLAWPRLADGPDTPNAPGLVMRAWNCSGGTDRRWEGRPAQTGHPSE